MQFIIFSIIVLAEFFTSPKILLFYDQIEYLKIVSNHNFWQVFSLGHFPIHPFFQAIFWITSRLMTPNYTAYLFAIISGILIYKISKIIFKGDKYFWLPAVTFLVFPGVWLVNTNLMIQSILLTFYLLALYLFIKKKLHLFSLVIFLMIGIDLDALYWIPTIFLLPFLFEKEVDFDKKESIKYLKSAILAVILSILFYAFIYIFVRREFGGSTEQLGNYLVAGVLRGVRNIWVSFINNFGSLTPFLLAFVLLKKVRTKTQWFSWMAFIAFFSIGGAFWAGDLMMRRIVFAGVIISIALYKYLGKKSVFLILFLLPITGLNSALYYKNAVFSLAQMQQTIDGLPKDQVLISSHYYYPFIKYDGKILWFESDDMNQIDNLLENGTRVFMTKESITAPYVLVVGNNYHVTSLNKVGVSEAKDLFGKYKVDLYQDAFEIKFYSGEPSEDAKEPVVFYGESLEKRLSRKRMNFGDVGIWIWSVLSGHKDAAGFTYKDASGAWVCQQIGI